MKDPAIILDQHLVLLSRQLKHVTFIRNSRGHVFAGQAIPQKISDALATGWSPEVENNIQLNGYFAVNDFSTDEQRNQKYILYASNFCELIDCNEESTKESDERGVVRLSADSVLIPWLKKGMRLQSW